jgi:Ca-activated chloride channel homolog
MMIRFIFAALAALTFLGAGADPVQAQDAPRVMIVMDGSGSMWGRIGKQPKLKIAKRAVGQMLKRLPPELEVGLMAYGHRTEGDCDDIQVLVKPQANSAGKIRRALGAMKFQGKTPLAAALREAAEALGYEDRPVTVVMVTDGLESCRMDPCKVAAQLEADGFDFTAHVIGFGLTPKQGARLSCIAKRTGGKYYPARNAKALARALASAVLDEEAPAAIDQANPDAADTPVADATEPSDTVDVATLDAPAVDIVASKKKGAQAAVADVPSDQAAAYFRGAPVMLNTALTQTGSIGIVAQSPAVPAFPATGAVMDCQIACEGDLLCAAWSYAPKGTISADGPQCSVFDYAAALDYADQDPAAGWASGMKVSAVQLVRPYVPAPVVPATVEEPVADTTATTGIAVEVTAGGGAPADLAVTWSAIPLDNSTAEVVETDGPVTGPWTVSLPAGEYAVEGQAEGFAFEDYITVSDTATRFEIAGFGTGDDPAATPDEGDEMATDETAMDAPEVTADEVPADEAVAVEEPSVMATVTLVDPAVTLALPGTGQKTDAGYLCDGTDPCGLQDGATGLVFALPPGWATDAPAPVPGADGSPSALLRMTLFGPEESDGSIPTLILNPDLWTDANGACTGSGAGALCVWGPGTDVTRAAVDLIAPSLVVAAVVEPAAEGLVVEEPATEVPVATEEPAATEPVAPPPGAGILPADGSWTAAVATPVLTQCPAGLEAAFAPATAALTGPRDIAWGGAFDPAKLGLDPGLGWQPVAEDTWHADGAPAPVEGQPPFILASLSADAVVTGPDKVTGQLVLTAFADGVGVVNLLNVGLAQCRGTADFTLTRAGG